ncbi:MAG: hypothetical protein LKM31_08905 [Sphingobium sp.]|nr:hypothetical protein [Sphingobium sp.]
MRSKPGHRAGRRLARRHLPRKLRRSHRVKQKPTLAAAGVELWTRSAARARRVPEMKKLGMGALLGVAQGSVRRRACW